MDSIKVAIQLHWFLWPPRYAKLVYTHSDLKIKFNLASAIAILETANFVQVCTKTIHKRAILMAHMTKFPFEFLYGFHKCCLSISSTWWCKKSKIIKSSKEGWSCHNHLRSYRAYILSGQQISGKHQAYNKTGQ